MLWRRRGADRARLPGYSGFACNGCAAGARLGAVSACDCAKLRRRSTEMARYRRNFEVWSHTHSAAAALAGSMLAAQHMAHRCLPVPSRCRVRGRRAADRQRDPVYTVPTALSSMHHFILSPTMPLRISANASLRAYHNVFSTESFMDELASRPAPLRRFQAETLDDPRGREVIEKARKGSMAEESQKPPRSSASLCLCAHKNLRAALCGRCDLRS